VPWLRPVAVGSVKKPVTRVQRSADLIYSAEQRQAELSRAYLAGVRELEQQADLTSEITDDQARPFAAALLRLESSAWRGRGGEATKRVKRVRDAVDERIGGISITGVDTPRVLAGASGSVAISVHNGLDKNVHLVIQITSKNPRLIQVGTGEGGAYRREIRIRTGNNQTIQVPMTARDGGEARVTVQLATIDGTPYGDPEELTVQATGYTGIALVIVGGALTVMLAAAVLRILRRRPRPGRAVHVVRKEAR
jgi:hypothetical protein